MTFCKFSTYCFIHLVIYVFYSFAFIPYCGRAALNSLLGVHPSYFLFGKKSVIIIIIIIINEKLLENIFKCYCDLIL